MNEHRELDITVEELTTVRGRNALGGDGPTGDSGENKTAKPPTPSEVAFNAVAGLPPFRSAMAMPPRVRVRSRHAAPAC
ncbi:MAG: hypothetical protein ACRDRE_25190, partial [Pseudonocardiaceae bacterium]